MTTACSVHGARHITVETGHPDIARTAILARKARVALARPVETTVAMVATIHLRVTEHIAVVPCEVDLTQVALLSGKISKTIAAILSEPALAAALVFDLDVAVITNVSTFAIATRITRKAR